MIYGRKTPELPNVIYYDIAQEEASQFVAALKDEMTVSGCAAEDAYFQYALSYRPVFEDVISILSEIGKTSEGSYVWGIERGCIYFPAFEKEDVPEDARKAYERTMTAWLQKQ